jgi:5-methylcytosine-specific restriction endonuclease McrBC GTP-binding regulatory subunit McrB
MFNAFGQGELIGKACLNSANSAIAPLNAEINSKIKSSSAGDGYKNIMILIIAFADNVKKSCDLTDSSVIEILSEAKKIYSEAQEICIQYDKCKDFPMVSF